MSRRFGRNQRRRAREALEQANAQLVQQVVARTMAEELMRSSIERTQEYKRLLGQFTSRVGRYAIAENIPASFTADWLGRMSQFRLLVKPEFDADSMFSNAALHDVTTICAEVMRVLDVEVVRDHMKRDMHVRLHFDDHHVGYGISDHAIRNLPRKDLIDHIARETAIFLVEKLKTY